MAISSLSSNSPFTPLHGMVDCSLSTNNTRSFATKIFDLYAKNHSNLLQTNDNLLSWMKDKKIFDSTPKTTAVIKDLLKDIENNASQWDLKTLQKNLSNLKEASDPESSNYQYEALSLFLYAIFEKAISSATADIEKIFTYTTPFAEETLLMKINIFSFKYPTLRLPIAIAASVVLFVFVTPLLTTLALSFFAAVSIACLVLIFGAGTTSSILVSYTLVYFAILIAAQALYIFIKLAQDVLMHITGLSKPENSQKTLAKVINGIFLSITFPTEIILSMLQKTVTPWPVPSDNSYRFTLSSYIALEAAKKKDKDLQLPKTCEKAFLHWMAVSHITLHAMFKKA